MDDLRKKIIAVINQIDDAWILRQIHRCAVNMTKEENTGERPKDVSEGGH